MRAVTMVFVQSRIHNLCKLTDIQRFVMIIQTFPLKRADKPLDKRLFLGGFEPCPVLGNAPGGKIALCILYVLTAIIVDNFDDFPEMGSRFLQSGCGVPA
jgi:hypothetical protein